MAASQGKYSAKPALPLATYLRARLDPLTSLVFATPVFLLYSLGVPFMKVQNGVDIFTSLLISTVHQDLRLYVAVIGGMVAGLFGTMWFLRSRGVIRAAAFGPVLAESCVWALILWLSVGWATAKLLHMQLAAGAPPVGISAAIVLSAGAGFYEELVFRAGFFSGGSKIVTALTGFSPVFSLVLAGVVSSVIFSAVHYLGTFGDAFELSSFTFRALMGLMLAAIYRFRGFAVAVYAHALYDALYFVVLS